MPELDAFDVEGRGANALRLAQDLVGGHVEELGLAIDEPLHQPWARDTVDLGVLARHPFRHGVPS